MIEVGATWTPFGVRMRVPNKVMATDAYARFMNEMPEARWSIVESSVVRSRADAHAVPPLSQFSGAPASLNCRSD
jgi:hypothetical protein